VVAWTRSDRFGIQDSVDIAGWETDEGRGAVALQQASVSLL